MAHGKLTNVLVGALALLLFPIPTWAQANDTAYCVELGELVLRYAGSPGADGETRPTFAAIE
ncbi:MAG: hypothetical protein Q8M19_22890, partial [Reyranella sp.]|nr:hypothetical protein [Reyranella sp.]